MGMRIAIHEVGGPEVLSWESYDPGRPKSGEVPLEQEAAGLNFIDVYHRTGYYALPTLPHGLSRSAGQPVQRFLQRGDYSC